MNLPRHEDVRLGALGAQAVPSQGEEFARVGCVQAKELQGLVATILFVEDEAFVREVAGEILRSAGYRVLRARTGEEAFAAYRECDGQVDLLLSDIVLPGENGRKLAERLRRENAEIKILFITGYIEEMVARGPGKHGEEYLHKPFSAQALLQRVRRLLGECGKQRVGEGSFKRAGGNGEPAKFAVESATGVGRV
jgi:CheY-like chemotaxis protein